MFKKLREYENLHIALWLIKDTCWAMTWRIPGMIMIIPTLFVAIHIAYKTRKHLDDLFHNIAVCLWITANATWMTGEFFFKDERQEAMRSFATIFFGIGLVVVAIYYVIYLPKRNKQQAAYNGTESDMIPAEEALG
jgi:uncharacterized membrane protein (GlpM family)